VAAAETAVAAAEAAVTTTAVTSSTAASAAAREVPLRRSIVAVITSIGARVGGLCLRLRHHDHLRLLRLLHELRLHHLLLHELLLERLLLHLRRVIHAWHR